MKKVILFVAMFVSLSTFAVIDECEKAKTSILLRQKASQLVCLDHQKMNGFFLNELFQQITNKTAVYYGGNTSIKDMNGFLALALSGYTLKMSVRYVVDNENYVYLHFTKPNQDYMQYEGVIYKSNSVQGADKKQTGSILLEN